MTPIKVSQNHMYNLTSAFYAKLVEMGWDFVTSLTYKSYTVGLGPSEELKGTLLLDFTQIL